MANDKLAEQSMDFAVQIINLVKQLKEQRESIISNQIGRSGTSIGANIREAKYAHGTADFISKMQIALKEANETGYWLELLYKTNYIGEEQYNFLESKCKFPTTNNKRIVLTTTRLLFFNRQCTFFQPRYHLHKLFCVHFLYHSASSSDDLATATQLSIYYHCFCIRFALMQYSLLSRVNLSLCISSSPSTKTNKRPKRNISCLGFPSSPMTT